MRFIVCFFTLLILSSMAQAQVPKTPPAQRLAPSLRSPEAWQQSKPETFVLVVSDWEACLDFLSEKAVSPLLLSPENHALVLRAAPDWIGVHLLPQPWLRFLDRRIVPPREERSVRDFDLSVNRINLQRRNYPSLRGQGQRVSVKENRFDSLDLDLRGRYFSLGLASAALANHATTMATIIGGNGETYYTGRGLAPHVALTSSSFFRLLPDPDSAFRANDLWVQNHSYGVEPASYYGAEAQAYDRQLYAQPALSHVFSVGNAGLDSVDHGPYAGLSGWANTTGNFKQALNVLTVGAVDSFLRREARSSRGPTYDGRIKPELVAFGQDGSSGAAAIASGTLLLLQQAYQARYQRPAPGALLRALLLNSAQDLGPPGPDHSHGYGNLDGHAALQQLYSSQWWLDSLAQGQERHYDLDLPAGVQVLKLTLAWRSPPGSLDGSPALQHDLDLSLERLSDGATWQPWVLSNAPEPDSLQQPALRGVDRLHPQEQLTLARPEAGRYRLRVRGHRLTHPEGFALVWGTERQDTLAWTYPTRVDLMSAGRRLPLRWHSTLSAGSTAELALRWVGQSDWAAIAPALPLEEGYARWAVPDTFAQAQLRLRAGGQTAVSDTFTVGTFPDLDLVVNCADEYRLSWPPQPGADRYQFFSWQENRLAPIGETADTTFALPKALVSEPWVAVTPLLPNGTPGRRSPAFNLDFQFAGCYLDQFFLRQAGTSIELEVGLGTTAGVATVRFEKRLNGTFVLLDEQQPSAPTLVARDRVPQQGLNVYRAEVQLDDGQVIGSGPLTWLYAGPETYYVYPNPVPQGGDLVFLTQETQGAMLQLVDATGRVVQRRGITGDFLALSTFDLPRGLYYWFIIRQEEIEAQGKLLVE